MRIGNRIAIIGGAFDPPTLGHLSIAKEVLKRKDIDVVWFVPCVSHPYNKDMSDRRDRVAMLSLMCGDEKHIVISNIELDKELDGTTFSLIKELNESWSALDFSIVIGADNAINFHKWFKYEELISQTKVRFIVMPRHGYPVIIDQSSDDPWFDMSPHVFMRDTNLPNISSSEIRKELGLYWANPFADPLIGLRFIKDNLHPEVYKYVLDNTMYVDESKLELTAIEKPSAKAADGDISEIIVNMISSLKSEILNPEMEDGVAVDVACNGLDGILTKLKELGPLSQLVVHCYECNSVINEPGALLFEPPDLNDKSTKRHYCADCIPT